MIAENGLVDQKLSLCLLSFKSLLHNYQCFWVWTLTHKTGAIVIINKSVVCHAKLSCSQIHT